MPYREFRRSQLFLLPPALDDFVPRDHPARFVGEFVSGLDLAALGIKAEAAVEGRPGYRPELLLSCWLYGFMTHVRSCRDLERACTENVAFMWLTGLERPDHNTLWRFYHQHRPAMRRLFQQTAQLAVEVKLVDFQLQAVDGTKIEAAAADRRTLRRPALEALLKQVEADIAVLEAQNAAEKGAADGSSWRLPAELTDEQRLRERIQAAMQRLNDAPERTTVNLTDPDAGTMHAAHGYITGYNAQAVADSKAGILVGMDVRTNAADQIQLVPMLEETQATTGRLPKDLVADGGYYSGANVAAAEQRDVRLFAPQPPPGPRQNDPAWPYHISHFRYDPMTDTYTCPQDKLLVFEHEKKRGDQRIRMYRGQECDGCPVRAACTQDPRGRGLTRYPWEQAVADHRTRMATEAATARMQTRRQLIEPVFGIIKERLGLRRFLLRGCAGVRAEWHLMGSAYNLRKLYRYWWRPTRAGFAV